MKMVPVEENNKFVNGASSGASQNTMYGYEEGVDAGRPSLPSSPLPRKPERALRRSGLRGIRSISTQKRDEEEQEQPRTGRAAEFVVHSIRRGSQEWRVLVKPFVADLAYYCIQNTNRTLARQPLVRPYTTRAAVMFVDISGYSKIAAALADRGAHALSTAVNAYLSRLLHIVRKYGGDVVKFAGDAVLCLWHGGGSSNDGTTTTQDEAFRQNILAAAVCAVKLQEEAGTHPVEGTPHVFRIHVGLCCGHVESEIFQAPQHVHMQRLFHLVGGEALEAIGDLVDLAAAGEVCVSGKVADVLQQANVEASFAPVDWGRISHDDLNDDDDSQAEDSKEPLLLTQLAVSPETQLEMDFFCEDTLVERMQKRGQYLLEEDFIHPAVLDLLSHGGMSPTQIAQMRDLVVLFIAKTSHESAANWLLQVQGILDRNQCPLLQVVADDKGVHAIAAVNAVSSVPESRLLGLEICRELVEREIGVSIGMAAGPTFCGVTGSSSVACRWDITGAPAVRAARLMQYALKHEVPLAVDASVSQNSNEVPARMTLLQAKVPIKGSPEPIKVYTLSDATEFGAMNLLETINGDIHTKQVEQMRAHITGRRHRSAAVITGPTLSGKKIACQRAAGFANMVPYLHTADSSYGLLQLVRTVAKWFKYTWDHENVRHRAKDVLNSMDRRLYSRAHDECLALVDDAIEAGLMACFVVDRVEFLDDFSLSFIRECLHGRNYRRQFGQVKYGLRTRRREFADSLTSMSDISIASDGNSGRIAFLCVHVPLYNSPDAQSVVDDITRSHRSLSVPIIEVGQVTMEELTRCFASNNALISNRLLYTGASASGYCIGYYIERLAAMGQNQIARQKAGLRPLTEMKDDLEMTIPPGMLRQYRKVTVMQVGPHIAMRYGHVYDDLPPIMQVFCKALAVVSQTEFYWAPRDRVWEVMNDLVAQGVENDVMTTLLEELKSMYVIQVWVQEGKDYIKFLSPAMADIAMDVCTPVQVESIAKAWIGRLEADKDDDFRVWLVLAWLHHMVDPCRKCAITTGACVSLWQGGFDAMTKTSIAEKWSASKLNRWKELIASEIEAMGRDVADILGKNFSYDVQEYETVHLDFLRLWWYRGPISLGPLGTTISVIAGLLTKEVRLCIYDASPEKRHVLLEQKRNACNRYLRETEILDELLAEHSLGMSKDDLNAERNHIETLAAPASSRENAFKFANVLMGTLLPRFVEKRILSMRELAGKMESMDVPSFVSNVNSDPIRNAYKVMYTFVCGDVSQATEVNNAQHALMVLANCGWEPREPPEPLDHLKRQSTARLRNAVVRTLSEGQVQMTGHQQGAVDFKAFLISTALLYHAQDNGKYERDTLRCLRFI